MATDLSQLTVSLTKHGANKIAVLIEEFNKDQILDNVWGRFENIHIDRAQTTRILSISEGGEVPVIWSQIKNYGREDIYDLVFVAIVFSHYKTIQALIEANENDHVLINGRVLVGKEYTNFAHIIDKFDYSIEHTADHIRYDHSRVITKFYLVPFIVSILELKLRSAGWGGDNSVVEECISLGLHRVFDLNENEFKVWLESGDLPDPEIQFGITGYDQGAGINFKEGHNSKYEGKVETEVSKDRKMKLLHNKYQNHLFKRLQELYPEDKIGTEIQAGTGSIDIVRSSGSDFVFYEIKTSQSAKTNIRSGLSQLMEYAFWNPVEKIDSLVILSPAESTERSRTYISLLRDRFGIPIYFQYFNPNTMKLGEAE